MPAPNVNLGVHLPANWAAMKCKLSHLTKVAHRILAHLNTEDKSPISITECIQTVSLKIFSTTEPSDSSNSSETIKILNSHVTEETAKSQLAYYTQNLMDTGKKKTNRPTSRQNWTILAIAEKVILIFLWVYGHVPFCRWAVLQQGEISLEPCCAPQSIKKKESK